MFGRQGALKGGQIHKVAQDILKLITVRRFVAPTGRLVMVFADDEAAKIVRGGGWLAKAARAWDVEAIAVTPDPKFCAELVTAQGRQRVVGLPVE